MLFLKITLLKNMAPLNRKLTNETVIEKSKALKDIGKRLSNKCVAKKFVVPRNKESTLVENGLIHGISLVTLSGKKKPGKSD